MGVVFGGATILQIGAALEAIQGTLAACFPALLAICRVSATGDDHFDKEAKERNQALQRRSSKSALPHYMIYVSSPLGEKPTPTLTRPQGV